jgi:Holliday junction resolvase RusA-like endonuclease
MFTQTQRFQQHLLGISTPGILVLALPFPPTANARWQWGNGRVRKSRRISQYEVDVAEACLLQLIGVPRPLQPPYAMSVELWPSEHYERPDLDNTLKNLMDALVCAGVLVDDKHLEAISVVYAAAEGVGQVHLQVWTLNQEATHGEPEAPLPG